MHTNKYFLEKKAKGLDNKLKLMLLLLSLALLGLASSCSSKNTSDMVMRDSLGTSPIIGQQGPSVKYKGKNIDTIRTSNFQPHVLVSDGEGGLALIENKDAGTPDPAYMDAREFKLKIRELAEQLVAGSTDPYMRTAVAMPVSFVRVDNLNHTSNFGRLVAEQLIYEFNQRGFPVKEYRIDTSINAGPGNGEYYLKRSLGRVATKHPGALIIAGTYHADPHALIVNARLIRPSDGRVLSTGNLVMPNTQITKRMLAGNVDIKGSGIEIKAARPSTRNFSPESYDTGMGIH